MPNLWDIDILVLNGGWNDNDSFRIPQPYNLAIVQMRDPAQTGQLANSKGKAKGGHGVYFTIRAGCGVQVSSFNADNERFFVRGEAGAVVEILYQSKP